MSSAESSERLVAMSTQRGLVHPGRASVRTALGELKAAQEELRVAVEEVRQQQARIEKMVADHVSGQRWRDHLLSVLPVGLLATDSAGVVQEGNAAVADLLGVRPDRLVGKPLPSYIELADRARVRDMLERLASGSTEERSVIALRPPHQAPRRAEIVGLRLAEDPPGRVRWGLVPQDLGARATAIDEEAAVAGGAEGASDVELRTATALARLYALPVEECDQQRLLSQMAVAIRSAITAATAVSISLGSPRAPERLASDSTEAQRFDGLQLRLGEGPCVDAYEQEAVVIASDVGRDPRWPRLAAEAREANLRSVLALPLRVGEECAGVLNVYASGASTFPAHAHRVGELVAWAVATVLEAVGERASLQALVHHLERALSSRAVIEQAKGIVMAHQGGGPDEAFAKLVAFSCRNNVKVRDLATLIVQDGGTAPLGGL